MKNQHSHQEKPQRHQNDYLNAENNTNSHCPPLNQHKIQIVVSKKKPEVIQLDSSDEAQKSKVLNGTSKKASKQPLGKTKKIKKFSPKCKICNRQGKKVEMKGCVSCKNLYHLVCLNFDNIQVPKKFVCEKCKYQRQEEDTALKKIKKADPKQLEVEKIMARKMDKEKRKQQLNKKLADFLERYPYYCQDNKVKFPIEDRLLIVYRDLFEVNDHNRLFPMEHSIVPSRFLGDLLQIENFFSTFYEQLEEDQEIDARKVSLYYTLNSQGPDRSFKLMVGCLLKIYLKDVLQRNKTDNVKTLNDNCFFTLISNLKENQELDSDFLAKVSVQVVRFLSTIPSMKKAFENFTYPKELNFEGKTYVLLTLIKGMSEVDEFHELVSRRSDKILGMTKQRGDLVTKLKKDEAEVLSNKQKMREITTAEEDRLQKKLIEDPEPIAVKKDKEADKNKKKLMKLTTQKEKSELFIKQFRTRINQISRSISFMTSQVLFLGLDRNRSEYFFFNREPHRLYVHFRQFLLSDDTSYLTFDGKDKIMQFVKTLSGKGIQQKHLSQNINALIKEGIIHDQSIGDQYKNCTTELFINQKRNFREEVNIQGIIHTVIEVEQKFSAYLMSKNLQWQSYQQRSNFVDKLKVVSDIQDLKDSIKQMQQHFLFVENIQPDKNNHQENSSIANYQGDEHRSDIYPMLFKKKVAIRIWGINSEKIKKYWLQYLELCIDAAGLWICVFIFKSHVDKYIKRKVEHQQQTRKRNQKIEKQKERQRLRQWEREKYYETYDRERSRSKQIEANRQRSRSRSRDNRERGKHQQRVLDISSSEQGSNHNLRKSTRLQNKKLTIVKLQSTQDSDYEEATPQPDEEDSGNDDFCQICGDFGDMICCDTCPKVYHLECVKIKEVPEGDWSCFKCLEKLANERQTRSRTKNRVIHR